MSKCEGIMGYVFGHKFEPRFSKGPSQISDAEVFWLPVTKAETICERFRQKDYKHDVCVRCGSVVNEQRQHPTPH